MDLIAWNSFLFVRSLKVPRSPQIDLREHPLPSPMRPITLRPEWELSPRTSIAAWTGYQVSLPSLDSGSKVLRGTRLASGTCCKVVVGLWLDAESLQQRTYRHCKLRVSARRCSVISTIALFAEILCKVGGGFAVRAHVGTNESCRDSRRSVRILVEDVNRSPPE